MPVNTPAPTPVTTPVTTPGTEIKNTSLCIWFFHDQRPGHLKQLQGLASRLQAHARVDIIWLDIAKYRLSIRHLFKPTKALNKLPKPNIVIGAGHQTHFSVLLAAYHFKAFSTLIMKPSLPLGWFDAIICPEHDQVAASANILRTFGPLNSVTPPISSEQIKERTDHLILIGGPSKHYQFESEALLVQIQQLCQENSENQWILSNSPRTPADFLTQVKALNLPNLAIHDYAQSSLTPLDSLLIQSKIVWLTPDSMSMIFEALTAGARVGLFDGTPQAGS
jgi:mitochondrial fission protein ELM1